MSFKRYTLWIILFICHDALSAEKSSTIVKSGDGAIELEQQLSDDSWKLAKYNNGKTSFSFTLEDSTQSFFLPYSAGIEPYYKVDIAPLGRAADFQCFYLDITSGCITRKVLGSDCAEASPKVPEDIDPRRKASMTAADFQTLKALNGERLGPSCGIAWVNNKVVNVDIGHNDNIVAKRKKSTVSLCDASEKELFGCSAKGKIASLCLSVSPKDGAKKARYKFGTPEKTELVFPAAEQPNGDGFFLSSRPIAGGSDGRVRFANGKYQYIIYDVEAHYGYSGVLVRKDNKNIAQIKCDNDATLKSSAYNFFPVEEFDTGIVIAE